MRKVQEVELGRVDEVYSIAIHLLSLMENVNYGVGAWKTS